jgi:isopropylmalate/homocitrate/citramalate synthase
LQILDSTLREGELFQIFPRDTRVLLASKLADAGVRRVELTVDYPPRTTSDDLKLVISALRDRGVDVILHGRAVDQDVDAIARYEVQGCGLYIAVSKLHREHKLHGITQEVALERLNACVLKARRAGMGYVRATLEDASRQFLEEGEEFLDSLGESIDDLRTSGATLVSLPDTSGLLSPALASEFFRRVKTISSLPVAAHFHNDYVLASANTIQAALQGADELHVTVMGIGDRNGIADLYEVVASLEDIHAVKTGVDRRALRDLYDYFAKLTGISSVWRHPLSTEARTIRAGVHQSMTVKRKDGYIPVKKLTFDFEQPLYAVSAYLSRNLIQSLLDPHLERVEPDSVRRIAELLAVSRSNGHGSKLENIQSVIRREAGVEISKQELSRFFGEETVYLLLKLQPQARGDEIARDLAAWDEVEAVDEVYGEVDMVVRAHTGYGKSSVITEIRKRYADSLLDLKVLVTD